MSKNLCGLGFGPMPDPSFARRPSRATGPKIKQAAHAPVSGHRLDGFEAVVTVAGGVAIAAVLAILIFGVSAANERLRQNEHWSKLSVDYMAEKWR